MTDAELATLNIELTTDPLALGYIGKTDPEIAVLINAVGSGTIPNTDVLASKIRGVYDMDEFETLPANHALFALAVVSNPNEIIDITDADLIKQMKGIFPVATFPVSRAALTALATRNATRAEVVFGKPITISVNDIAVSLGRF